MMTDLIIGGLIGMLATFILLMFIAGFVAVIYFIANREYKFKVRIRNMTGGKAVVEMYKAKKLSHERLGECYYVPALKSQKRHLLPYHGSNFELPISGKRWYVPFTYYNGEYTPEEFDPFSAEIEQETIEKAEDGTFAKIKKKIRVFILRPVNKSIRKWVLDADRVANEENTLKLNWFERNKELILIALLLMVAAVISFLMILFSYQYGVDVINNVAPTPQWAIDLLNASTTASVPPQIGG